MSRELGTAGTVRIRDAVPADANAIARVRIRSWQAGYAGIVPDQVLADMTAGPNPRLERRLRDPTKDSPILVSEVDGVVTGFVNAGPYRVAQHPGQLDPAQGGEIYAIYVDPGHWGNGAGGLLLAEAVARLRRAGLAPIRLWVLADNDRSRRFYEHHGFGGDGTSELFVVDDGTALTEVRYRLE